LLADEIPKGTKVDVDGTTVEAIDTIPYGHKMALRPIPKGETVLKYGLSIGSAISDIQPGNHVHVHNVESNRGRGDKYQEA
jgi:altronate dehydratase small subunit